MKLISLIFVDHPGENREWRVEPLIFGDINLVVGINASGKSHALAAIANLAWLVSGQMKLGHKPFAISTTIDGDYEADFEHDGKSIKYVLRFRQSKVIEEKFLEGTTERMSRGLGGQGQIDAERQPGVPVLFQTPETELAVVARKDSIQHSFFNPLHEWADSVYRYEFGSLLGKRSLVVQMPERRNELDPKNQEHVIAMFLAGDQARNDFKESIKTDMRLLGYDLEDIGMVGAPWYPGAAAKYLSIKEKDIVGSIEQAEISQGMFRALSLIIQMTYSQMFAKPTCIIVDDIGEGLDFARSCALISLLIEKTKAASIQLIMSTNDRFVMNKVPLDAWTILRREKGISKVYNYHNSKAIFDRFEYTGMNNFDFLATDFIGEMIDEAPDKVGVNEEKTCDLR